MALKFRKKIILAKIETTYGVDASPTGGANAMLVGNVDFTPLDADTIERGTVQPNLGARQRLHVGVRARIQFDVEIAGSGALGTVPGYGPLLRACGLSETVTASTKVEYAPVSANEESVTIHFFGDGQKHALLGCRGSVSLTFNKQAIPVYRFSFTGLYAAPATAADPSPTLTAFQLPKHVSTANTPTLSLHSFAGKVSQFSLDQGNNVIHRALVNEESIQITDRRVGGSLLIEAPVLSTKDFFAIARAETLGALSVIHGTVAGNIVELAASNVQVLQPGYTEEDGVVMLNMGLNFVASAAGNDDFLLTIR